MHAHTHTPDYTAGMGDSVVFGPEQTFSKEVDDKANAYFQVGDPKHISGQCHMLAQRSA